MNLLNLFARKASAPVARERLQLLLAHERAKAGHSDLIAILREEILNVITKHVPLDRDRIQVRMERGETVSTLEVEVEVPNEPPARLKLAVNG
jgi:cell division topological specificity factor